MNATEISVIASAVVAIFAVLFPFIQWVANRRDKLDEAKSLENQKLEAATQDLLNSLSKLWAGNTIRMPGSSDSFTNAYEKILTSYYHWSSIVEPKLGQRDELLSIRKLVEVELTAVDIQKLKAQKGDVSRNIQEMSRLAKAAYKK